MCADFEPISVLGMMSGTSLDGVDAALLRTDGAGVIEFGPSSFAAYSDQERDVLKEVLGLWPGLGLQEASEIVLRRHSELASQFAVDLIGFHGQTLAHDPDAGRTHQLGDGAQLAQITGRDVVWDFRSTDMCAGGQGAPLAPFFHHALARHLGLSEPVAFLNLGGVGNVTWVDPLVSEPEQKGAICAFDTGPANALLDDFLKDRTGQSFDKDGNLAAQGSVPAAIWNDFEELPYFLKPPPKSLDRDDFKGALAQVSQLKVADGAASLTELTSTCVGRALPHLPSIPTKWLVCGGGRHNRVMMEKISSEVGTEVEPVEAVGLNGDMLEAQAFAWLAVRVLRGLPTSSPGTTGCVVPVSGGHISKA